MSDALLTEAVKTFQTVRERAIASETQRPPSTSELIDWVHILRLQTTTPEALQKDPQFPPQWQTLFKTYHDLKACGRRGRLGDRRQGDGRTRVWLRARPK